MEAGMARAASEKGAGSYREDGNCRQFNAVLQTRDTARGLDFTSGNFYTFTVSTKTIDPNVGGLKKIITNFVYDNPINNPTAKIDASSGSGKFNKVASTNANNGKIVNYFFNGMTDQSTYSGNADDYLLLEGNVYQTQMFNQANSSSEAKAVITTKKTYEVDFNPPAMDIWPLGIFDKRITKIETDSLGVSREINYLSPNFDNGLPEITKETNSDGSQKFTKTIFAYTKFTDMGPNYFNMLTQPCQTIIYEKAKGNNTAFSAADVRAAKAITWSKYLGNSAWMPHYTFIWNNQMGVYTEFNFSADDPSSSNPSWQYMGNTETYSIFGAPLEIKNGKKISSSTVYRNDVHLPIGSISNANSNESAIFTGDYDLNECDGINYFDKLNGWVKGHIHTDGGINEVTSVPHFGLKSLHVKDSYGPWKKVFVDPIKDYIFSAWIKPVAGSPLFAVQVFVNNVQVSSADGTASGLPVGSWTLYQNRITSSQLSGMHKDNPNDYLYIWIGNNDTPYRPLVIPEFYVDDIRFYPVKALATTTYYDAKGQLPILTVDASGKPGQKTEYDDFDRPVKWWKISGSDPSAPVLVKKKDYVLMGDKLILKSPIGGSVYAAGKTLPISWMNTSWRTVKLSLFSVTNGTTTIIENSISPVDGQSEYSYNYLLPTSLMSGLDYTVAIIDVNNNMISECVRKVHNYNCQQGSNTYPHFTELYRL